jgi:hypothetical protein
MCELPLEMTKAKLLYYITAGKPGAPLIQSMHESCRSNDFWLMTACILQAKSQRQDVSNQ